MAVPGRVNLIGEHVDYHDLPVLPMAIQRRVSIAFRPRSDATLRIVSAHYGRGELAINASQQLGQPGDWVNYVRAAVQAAAANWDLGRGIDAAVTSDLPPAAGLSSSSALLTGILLALLEANGISPRFDELMAILPDGEQFVGTRGGGMDHAAVLGPRAGSALLVEFAPVRVSHIPIPDNWALLIAHSMQEAEKSGAVRAQYNHRKTAGRRAIEKLGFASFRSAIESGAVSDFKTAAVRNGTLSEDEWRSFSHVIGEAGRVENAIECLRAADMPHSALS